MKDSILKWIVIFAIVLIVIAVEKGTGVAESFATSAGHYVGVAAEALGKAIAAAWNVFFPDQTPVDAITPAQ